MTTKQHQNAPKVHTSHITAVPAAIVTQIRRSTSERSNRDDAHCHCRWDSMERPWDGWVRSSATAKCETNNLFETIQSIVRFQSNHLCTDYWGSSNYTYCRGSCWFKEYICWEALDCNELSQVLATSLRKWDRVSSECLRKSKKQTV